MQCTFDRAHRLMERADQGHCVKDVSTFSPELLISSSRTGGLARPHANDMWALGCYFYTLLTGMQLFVGENRIAVLRNVADLYGFKLIDQMVQYAR